MPLSKKKEWFLAKLIWVLEKISFLAWWVFIVSIFYGFSVCIVDYVNNPYNPIYLRMAVGSVFVFLSCMVLIFLLDDGEACKEFPKRKD